MLRVRMSTASTAYATTSLARFSGWLWTSLRVTSNSFSAGPVASGPLPRGPVQLAPLAIICAVRSRSGTAG